MKAVFLDRDGTINFDPGYISDPADFALLPGALEGLSLLSRAGFRLFVMSNQSGVGRGYFSVDDLARVNRRMEELLAEGGVKLDGIHCCLHRPEEGCACRKPATGLIDQAISLNPGIDLSASFFVGDKDIDVRTGKNAGCRTVFISGSKESGVDTGADFTAPDLLSAARWILKA